MSKYGGERIDLVQAGGGNTSVKLDNGIMLVKASGISLSEIEYNRGYVRVDNEKVLSILTNDRINNIKSKRERDILATRLMSEAAEGEGTPSIETYLHSYFYKYTMHVHPILVASILINKDWKIILQKLFPEAMMVGYRTPGLELALDIRDELSRYKEKHSRSPQIVFLQNHGVIISDNKHDNVRNIMEKISLKLEDFLKVDFSKYKIISEISDIVNQHFNSFTITYRSTDQILKDYLQNKKELFSAKPTCPDYMVYCGANILNVTGDLDIAIKEYKDSFSEYPRIILYNNDLFFIASCVRKAKEMEDVCKAQLISLTLCNNNPTFIEENEISYLGSWKAEKYRQNI